MAVTSTSRVETWSRRKNVSVPCPHSSCEPCSTHRTFLKLTNGPPASLNIASTSIFLPLIFNSCSSCFSFHSNSIFFINLTTCCILRNRLESPSSCRIPVIYFRILFRDVADSDPFFNNRWSWSPHCRSIWILFVWAESTWFALDSTRRGSSRGVHWIHSRCCGGGRRDLTSQGVSGSPASGNTQDVSISSQYFCIMLTVNMHKLGCLEGWWQM